MLKRITVAQCFWFSLFWQPRPKPSRTVATEEAHTEQLIGTTHMAIARIATVHLATADIVSRSYGYSPYRYNSYGYSPYRYRSVAGQRYYGRRGHSTRNLILSIAAPGAVGAGVGALLGGKKGAGVGALLGCRRRRGLLFNQKPQPQILECRD